MAPLVGMALLAACSAAPAQHPAANAGAVQPAAYSPAPSTALPEPSPAPDARPPSLAELAQNPARFAGLSAAEVLSTIGDPNFRRRESPAEVWQYYGPGCILDLFLYSDSQAAGAPAHVTYADLRGRADAAPEAACLARLIEQRKHQRPVS